VNLLRNRLLWSVAFGHFALDVFANLTPMMLPLLIVSFNLDYMRVGLIAVMFNLTSSLAQPFFGYLADRFGGRLLAPLGIAWTSLWIGAVGFAPDYYSLLAVLFLAGLGSAAFHPQGAMNAAVIGGKNRGSAVSVFMLGGNIGFALGPVIGGALFLTYGLKSTALLTLPGIVMAVLVYRAMSAVETNRQAIIANRTGPLQRPSFPIIAIVSLVLLIMLRSWTSSGLNNFIPLWYTSQGYSMDVASPVLLIILMGLAIGGLLGGFLSDRAGRRRVVALSLLLLSPVVYLFLQVPPPLSLAVAVPLGVLIGASTSVTIVMAQDLLPQNVGMASGLTLGLAFVTSSVGVTVTGNVADNFGLSNALGILAFLPLAGALLCWPIKPTRARAKSAELAET